MIESRSYAGHPRNIWAGHPPTESEAAATLSISVENGAFIKSEDHGMSDEQAAIVEAFKISVCEHLHQEEPAEDVTRAKSAAADLYGRTWKAGAEPGRDERRLSRRYKSILADHEARVRAAYDACPTCSSGSHHKE